MKSLVLGASIFGSIYQYEGRAHLNYILQSADNSVASFQYNTGFNQDSYGLFIKIGGNYHLEKVDLGININLPYLEVLKKLVLNTVR